MKQLSKTYEPHEHEQAIYRRWEESGAFKPDLHAGKAPFTVIMPPPNANGDLHIGHALTTTLQDIMIRYRRMQGHPTLYLPGADHAGFETQVVYERRLNAEGKSRFDFSRDELYQQIWDYVQANKSKMIDQQKRLGASADWSRETFTLDPHIVRRAHETFARLFADGLLYRGKRIVNYCTFHGTSFSDLEVEYQDDAGHLWRLAYPVEGTGQKVVVATSRPETMLGDTAVAVHPSDERYASLVGKMVRLPLVDRLIPIVADEHVDPQFGTGAVKVTPAHDPNDYEIGERHNLPIIQIIGTDGKITSEAPTAYVGLDVAAARKAVVAGLEAAGALEGIEDYTHSVGHCYKCGTVIEPLVIDQWLIRMQPLARRAMAALENGDIKIVPEARTKALFSWLENIRDWNVSRQIVWGIKIPAFFAPDGSVVVDIDETGDELTRDGIKYRRDADTFDTWFSSSQWPFATLNYPDSDDFKRFYPTSVMETAGEILFFWVARMMMLGLYVTGEVPFRTVYLHGLVLDAHGKKMSKSKGNVIAPQPLLEKYGTDALRLGIIANRSAGMSQGFDEKRVEGYRNFCNKLWNVARFILGQLPEEYSPADPKAKTLADAWILQRLEIKAQAFSRQIEAYDFSDAGQTVYSLLWDDFADWYVEASKVEPNYDVLIFGLELILKLLHPLAPFVSEAIWSSLPWQTGQLITEAWPEHFPAALSDDAQRFEAIKDAVSALRAVMNEESLVRPTVLTTDPVIFESRELIARLARTGDINQTEVGTGLRIPVSSPIWLDVDEAVIAGRKSRIEASLADKQRYLAGLEAKLSNERFVAGAPEAVIAETRLKRTETVEAIERFQAQLDTLLP